MDDEASDHLSTALCPTERKMGLCNCYKPDLGGTIG
uniref:Uncharacterized protein n=1 Tax=Arundo donax TaxID=35708 RepID=A0A0A9HAX4_ARUDO